LVLSYRMSGALSTPLTTCLHCVEYCIKFINLFT
jgi:hypothetical protein